MEHDDPDREWRLPDEDIRGGQGKALARMWVHAQKDLATPVQRASPQIEGRHFEDVCNTVISRCAVAIDGLGNDYCHAEITGLNFQSLRFNVCDDLSATSMTGESNESL